MDQNCSNFYQMYLWVGGVHDTKMSHLGRRVKVIGVNELWFFRHRVLGYPLRYTYDFAIYSYGL